MSSGQLPMAGVIFSVPQNAASVCLRYFTTAMNPRSAPFSCYPVLPSINKPIDAVYPICCVCNLSNSCVIATTCFERKLFRFGNIASPSELTRSPCAATQSGQAFPILPRSQHVLAALLRKFHGPIVEFDADWRVVSIWSSNFPPPSNLAKILGQASSQARGQSQMELHERSGVNEQCWRILLRQAPQES
jgi:hypothetical protein